MRRPCAHYTRTLLLRRQRRRPRPNHRIWRVPKMARRESHQRRRRAIFRLIESNQRQQSRQRLFSGTHLRNGARRNCSSALFSVRKRCCGGEDFTEVRSDGVFGPNLEFSLRAFQSRLGISPNGRLDMDTLAALGLLPGQRGRTSDGNTASAHCSLGGTAGVAANGFTSRFRSEPTVIRR
jgi:hypothetical protein